MPFPNVTQTRQYQPAGFQRRHKNAAHRAQRVAARIQARHLPQDSQGGSAQPVHLFHQLRHARLSRFVEYLMLRKQCGNLGLQRRRQNESTFWIHQTQGLVGARVGPVQPFVQAFNVDLQRIQIFLNQPVGQVFALGQHQHIPTPVCQGRPYGSHLLIGRILQHRSRRRDALSACARHTHRGQAEIP